MTAQLPPSPLDDIPLPAPLRDAVCARLGVTSAAPLPGTHAIDFFEQWLDHGTGGTCWSSSNALYMLLTALGFTARRIAG